MTSTLNPAIIIMHYACTGKHLRKMSTSTLGSLGCSADALRCIIRLGASFRALRILRLAGAAASSVFAPRAKWPLPRRRAGSTATTRLAELPGSTPSRAATPHTYIRGQQTSCKKVRRALRECVRSTYTRAPPCLTVVGPSEGRARYASGWQNVCWRLDVTTSDRRRAADAPPGCQ